VPAVLADMVEKMKTLPSWKKMCEERARIEREKLAREQAGQ